MIDQGMTLAKLAKAKLHVYNVCNQGQSIELIMPDTTVGSKDELGYILNEKKISLKVHPVRTSPYEKDVKERISWAEDTDVIWYAAKRAIDLIPTTIEKLRQNIRVRYNKKTYTLKYAEPFNSFGTDCLYVILGGKK